MSEYRVDKDITAAELQALVGNMMTVIEGAFNQVRTQVLAMTYTGENADAFNASLTTWANGFQGELNVGLKEVGLSLNGAISSLVEELGGTAISVNFRDLAAIQIQKDSSRVYEAKKAEMTRFQTETTTALNEITLACGRAVDEFLAMSYIHPLKQTWGARFNEALDPLRKIVGENSTEISGIIQLQKDGLSE